MCLTFKFNGQKLQTIELPNIKENIKPVKLLPSLPSIDWFGRDWSESIST
jgi:hypothetical protein